MICVPPQALQSHRKAVLQHHALNVRVFGSVLHGKDMDDSDLGLLVEPTLEAVTNNPDKFPAGYIIELSKAEKIELVENFHRFNKLKHSTVNPKVHEYVEDPVVLSSALQTGHAFVPALIATANKMITEIERRGWA